MSTLNSYLNSATLICLPSVSMQRETSVIFQTQSQNSQQKHGGCRKSCICMSWSNPNQQNTVYLSLIVYEMVILLFSWNMLLRRGFGRQFWRFQLMDLGRKVDECLCLKCRTCFRCQNWTLVTSVKTREWNYLSFINSVKQPLREELRLVWKLFSFRNY